MNCPIKTPYTTRPVMQKLVGDLYNKKPDIYYLEQKHYEISTLGNDLWAVAPRCDHLIEKACIQLGLPITRDIVKFATQFEEDVAIMHQGKLAAICFCFPSSWIPRERIGKSLTEIHQPVADGEPLISASEKLAKTMSDPVLGSFSRWVWTIKSTDRLSNHPIYSDPEPEQITDLYLRTEYQTTLPLGDGTSSLFFVKVKTEPLQNLWNDLEKQQAIIDSINSMSQNILEYKKLFKVKEIVNRSESLFLTQPSFDHAIG